MIEPPGGLRNRILIAFDEIAKTGEVAETGSQVNFRRTLRDVFRFRSKPSHALAFAAGTIAALCLFAVVWQLQPIDRTPHLEGFYGTIASGDPAWKSYSEALEIDHPRVSGHAQAFRLEDRYLVRLELDAPRPVKVIIEAAEQPLCEGYRAVKAGRYELKILDEWTELIHEAKGEYDIYYSDTQQVSPSFEVRVLADGAVIFQQKLIKRRD
jgi:hypothetical protein